MVSRFLVKWLVLWALAWGAAAGAWAQDITDGRDLALVHRYPGSTLIGYAQIPHGTLDFQTTTYTGFDLDAGLRRYAEPPLSLDGRVTRLWYESAGSATAATLFDYHAGALAKQGFQTLYDSAKDSGTAPAKWVNFLASFAPGRRDALANNRSAQVFSSARPASLRTATFQQDNTTVRLVAVDWPKADADSKARKGAYIAIDVVEARVLRAATPTTATAAVPVPSDAALNKALSAHGRATLDGLRFKSGSAELEEGARESLTGVAAYLKANVQVQLYVVGHTDGSGDLEGNLELSHKRAQAVVEILERDFAIAPGRLSAHGVGPLTPLADNRAAAGRARNRRVEIVRH